MNIGVNVELSLRSTTITDFVGSLVLLSPASEEGLKVGDILCKPGTKGDCLNIEDQFKKNIQIENNRPIVVEVVRILTDDDLVRGLLEKEQIKEVMLGKIHDERLKFGSVVDKLCTPEVYFMSFTYHMMATTILSKNMPQVTLELLNHVYYSIIDQGPGFPTTFVEDQLQWKPKCSKCGKFMYNKCHDLYTCVRWFFILWRNL